MTHKLVPNGPRFAKICFECRMGWHFEALFKRQKKRVRRYHNIIRSVFPRKVYCQEATMLSVQLTESAIWIRLQWGPKCSAPKNCLLNYETNWSPGRQECVPKIKWCGKFCLCNWFYRWNWSDRCRMPCRLSVFDLSAVTSQWLPNESGPHALMVSETLWAYE